MSWLWIGFAVVLVLLLSALLAAGAMLMVRWLTLD